MFFSGLVMSPESGRPGGFCVASYFLLDDERRESIDARRSFIPFPVEHSSGVCRLNNANTPEAAVAFDEAFIRGLHHDSGLRIRDVRRGQWWRGVAHDQDVIAAVHSDDERAKIRDYGATA
jgi:hypothetical protein